LPNDLAIRRPRDLAPFEPQATKVEQAKIDAVIDFAKTIKDWPLLEKAIDAKIEQQREFVEWWREKVSPNRGGDRKSQNQVPRSAHLIARDDAEKLTEITHHQVSKWATRLKREADYRLALYGAAYRLAMAEGGAGVLETLNTGDMEGYTPAREVEAARSALGSIDVDPASCEQAQAVIKAGTYFTRETDGLAHPWIGNVFLNPPYNSGLIEQFIAKLLTELGNGNARAAVLLTNNNTDTRWFHGAAMASTAICFTLGRIKFYKPDSSITAPTNGQTFFYFGEQRAPFVKAFAPLGLLVRKV